MRRLLTLGGVAVLITALAIPAFARGPGWGGRGNWGPDNCPNYPGPQTNLTEEQQKQLTDLGRKYYDSTAQLRSQIWSKRGEFRALMSSPSPDPAKAQELQRELSDLRAKMAQERLAYTLEERKIDPDARFQSGYGRGYGRGKSWGPGKGPGGYGPADCPRGGGYGPRGGYGRGAWN